MKHITLIILAALLVLGVAGTAVAQEINDSRRVPVGIEGLGPSRFDLAAPWGAIDKEDLLPLSLALNKRPGIDAPWAWDLNRDGIIDIADVGMVAARVGCTAADPCYW